MRPDGSRGGGEAWSGNRHDVQKELVMFADGLECYIIEGVKGNKILCQRTERWSQGSQELGLTHV